MEEAADRCPVCGGETGGFGSVRMAGGVLCGGCAARLSPWFRVRPDTAAADIRRHLEYREANRERAAAFRTERSLWRNPSVRLGGGAFLVSDAPAKFLAEENPDVLDIRSLLECTVELEETRREVKRRIPGQGAVSWRPRRYEYRFNVGVRILLAHPEFPEIRFWLNRRPIVVKGQDVAAAVTGKQVRNREYQACVRMAEEIRRVLLAYRAENLPPDMAE